MCGPSGGSSRPAEASYHGGPLRGPRPADPSAIHAKLQKRSAAVPCNVKHLTQSVTNGKSHRQQNNIDQAPARPMREADDAPLAPHDDSAAAGRIRVDSSVWPRPLFAEPPSSGWSARQGVSSHSGNEQSYKQWSRRYQREELAHSLLDYRVQVRQPPSVPYQPSSTTTSTFQPAHQAQTWNSKSTSSSTCQRAGPSTLEPNDPFLKNTMDSGRGRGQALQVAHQPPPPPPAIIIADHEETYSYKRTEFSVSCWRRRRLRPDSPSMSEPKVPT